MNLALLLLSTSLLMTAVAAVFDWRTGHIPNPITLGGLVVGSIAQVVVHALDPSFESLTQALLAAGLNAALGILVCGLVPYLLFRVEAMGGGDVKLLAAVGAFVGPRLGLELQLTAFVAMAVLAPMRLAYEGRLFSVLGNSAVLLVNPFLPKSRRRAVAPEAMTSFKFGPAVFAANLLVLAMYWVRA